MYEDMCYRKPFLKAVVARLDFVTPLVGVDNALPAKLGKVISDHFPIAEPTEMFTHEVQVNLNPAGNDVRQRRTPARVWNFFGKEREKKLSLGSKFVFIEYTSYLSYEDLRDNFVPVVSSIDGLFHDTRAARFGLRYVNEIAIEGLHPVNQWDEYISSALFALPALFSPERLTRLVHIAEMKCGELDVRFQFGLPNPDYPSPLKRPSFVLDFDAYIQAAHELRASLGYLDQAHACIQEIFERSITDKLRERMDVRPSPAVQE